MQNQEKNRNIQKKMKMGEYREKWENRNLGNDEKLENNKEID